MKNESRPMCTVMLLCCYAVTLLRGYTVMLLCCYTVTLLCCYPVMLLPCYKLSNCQNVMLVVVVGGQSCYWVEICQG